jgi:wyosine [tRNA(Phe)-imidazoG37] synthetase (radical SAM superfamily)
MTTNRSAFSDPDGMIQMMHERLEELSQDGIRPDTITFVSNGEPTLDKNLGALLESAKKFGIPTAVITNASLLWHPDTRSQLACADIVSLKVDTVIEDSWHTIDRPHGSLHMDRVFNGIHRFAQTYNGRLITETMLIQDINDTDIEAERAATFIADLHPEISYLALPLRPPAESWVIPPSEKRLMDVYQIFKSHIPQVELLMDLPKTELYAENDPIQSLLNTLQVHPLSKDEISSYLENNRLRWNTIEELVTKEILKPIHSQDTEFYVRTY